MSIIKYKTSYNATGIERVEVLRETEACVYLPTAGWSKNKAGERREAKASDYAQYHSTWSDAHNYLIRRAESAVKSARRNLEIANGTLGNVNGMKPPKDSA